MSKRGPTPLAPNSLFGPAFSGLNTERTDIIGMEDATWALVLENIRWNRKGKPESRLGYTVGSNAAAGAATALWGMHEFVRADQTTSLVTVSDEFKVYISTDDGASWSDITGTISTTTVKWQFVNFFDELYATAPGHQIYRYTGTGSFALVANSPVTRGVLLSAYGRLWAAVDGSNASEIKYCALTDGTDWTGTATGTIDASNAWTQGQDTVNALCAFGASFLIFGTKHILVYVDGAGSTNGIDPDNMYVVDTIEGTGTVHRDSVMKIGKGDVWWIGPNSGVQSLGRVIADKTNPLVGVSDNVLKLLVDRVASHIGSAGNIQAQYHAATNSALFLFPESSEIVYFDTKAPLKDGTYRCAEWKSQPFKSLCARASGSLVFGSGSKLAFQTAYLDNDTSDITIKYASPWLDWGPEGHNRLKIVKEATILAFGHGNLSGTLRWAFDYRPLEYSETFTSEYEQTGAEYAVGEYAQDEYGTGLRNRKVYVDLEGEGQYVQFQLELVNAENHNNIALQEVTIYAKPGTMV